ncbi:MAG TPA: mycothiol synthase [Ornithinimicrobium sp.]|uniref:mycothiol synthase n=1 Tax=Ornithinimicrobium sp. TaxID=1977084 RepID=UPI002B477D44|nr:mycothiol synthase [Ornithinimicrobium sp.]HKJ12978.1 mycothiol synthase [Ornithinimicrobium sp.]
MDVTSLDALPPARSADVLALAVRATTADGVKPLSEQTVLDVRRLPSEGAASTPSTHLLVFDAPGEIHARIRGYAHVEHAVGAEPAGFELVVHPDHRRGGVGTALLRHVLSRWPQARGWAHGSTEAAQALAAQEGLQVVREMWQMSRPLSHGGGDALPAPELPEGFSVRSFIVGQDEQAWLDVNAAAFADHPEQGRTTLEDLGDRMGETWFDPHGFLLLEDHQAEPEPRLAAFHWTKVEPATPGSSRAAAGEVYVVGVHPDYQGRGLGTLTTLLGLRHLDACGLPEVTLYVEGDNAPAIASYRRWGFERSGVDVMYAAANEA